jgi:hypothetical protein
MSKRRSDDNSIKRSSWIAGVGAVILLFSTFLNWWNATSSALKAANALGEPVSAHVSGWDTGTLGKLVFFTALIAIIAVVVDQSDVDTSGSPYAIPVVVLCAGALSVLLVVLRLLDTPSSVNRAFGLYIALIASVVLLYGGWLKLQET